MERETFLPVKKLRRPCKLSFPSRVERTDNFTIGLPKRYSDKRKAPIPYIPTESLGRCASSRCDELSKTNRPASASSGSKFWTDHTDAPREKVEHNVSALQDAFSGYDETMIKKCIIPGVKESCFFL